MAEPSALPRTSPVLDVAWRSYAQVFVRDIVRSTAWYRDVLGFAIAYSYGQPLFYAQVSRDAVAFNLRRTASPWVANAVDEELLAARLEVDDVKSLFLEFRDNGAALHRRLRTEPWGQATFVVRDPDGNLVSFGSPMPDRAADPRSSHVTFTPDEIDYLTSQPLARFSTVSRTVNLTSLPLRSSSMARHFGLAATASPCSRRGRFATWSLVTDTLRW